MSEIVADPLLPSRYQLFLRPGIQESQQLGPDPFLPRARDARGRLPRDAQATRGAGRAASPIPSGACPILSPGR